MFKFKITKFKQVYGLTFLPRLFLKQSKCAKEILHMRAIEQVSKSTDCKISDTPQCDPNENIFLKNKAKSTVEEDLLRGNIISPAYYQIPRCTKCEHVISRIFGISKSTPETKNGGKSAVMNATTASIEEEKLTQKIEVDDETPHVEAHPEVKGIKMMPKILGQQVSNCKASENKRTCDMAIDDLATRCLNTSINDIDNTVLCELNNISKTKSIFKENSERVGYAEKYFDENFQKQQKRLVSENMNSFGKIVLDDCNKSLYREGNEFNYQFKVEKIRPVHLDMIPLIAVEEYVKDFKEARFVNDTGIYLTELIEEPLRDVPSQLSPYDQQALPFYEYTNKEHILDIDPDLESAAMAEMIQQTEVVDHITKELDQEQSAVENLQTEEPLTDKPLNLTPTQNCFYEPLIKRNNGEPEKLYKNFTADHISNILSTQQLFSSSEQSGDWRSDGSSPSDHHNTAISGTYAQRQARKRRLKNLETQDTAISANQNPGEYYDWKAPVQFNSSYAFREAPRLVMENTVAQNIYISAMPERRHLVAKKESENITKPVADEKTYEQATVDKENPTGVSESNNNVPLSMLLKLIRKRSKIEYCQNILGTATKEEEVVKSNKSHCPPTKQSPPPCKPIAKPKKDPCPKRCPTKCPEKKDPCAKFVPFLLNILIKSDTSLDFKAPLHYNSIAPKKTQIRTHSLTVLTEEVIDRIKKLGETVRITNIYNVNSTCAYARDFEPWIPIPSSPESRIEKQKSFIHPKEGCKSPVRKRHGGKKCPKTAGKDFQKPTHNFTEL